MGHSRRCCRAPQPTVYSGQERTADSYERVSIKFEVLRETNPHPQICVGRKTRRTSYCIPKTNAPHSLCKEYGAFANDALLP